MQNKKPVSRIDSGRTHGYFARVYRDDWVGSRSFADGKYGGKAGASSASHKWAKMADEQLPHIPAKPILKKASYHEREEYQNRGLFYFDVYLPSVWDDSWTTEKLYFMTDDDRIQKKKQADQLINTRNADLQAAHREALAHWYVERDRIMFEILKMWTEIKKLEIYHDENK